MKRRDMLIGAAVTGAARDRDHRRGDAVDAGTGAGGDTARGRRDAGSDHQGKKIRVTAEVTSPPFGILDQQQPARRLGDRDRAAARRRISASSWNSCRSPARSASPRCSPGRADVAISSLSITFDRAKTVMFAPPHGALSIVIAGPKKTSIHSAADMAGKKIGLTRATLEEASVPRLRRPAPRWSSSTTSPRRCRRWSRVRWTPPACPRSPRNRSADRNPKAEIENKFTVRTAYYAAAVRPGDFDLLQFLRTWVFLNKHNGVLANIYKKYTEVALVDLPAL